MESVCPSDRVSSRVQARPRICLPGYFTVLLLLLIGSGCADLVSHPPAGSYEGRPGIYDYSPSVIQTGDVQQFWWCGGGNNPNLPSQVSDTIQYATVNVKTKQTSVPLTVLGESPGTWDSVYTCNPQVVEGVFDNPVGDGQTYTYAMYYVGTAHPGNINSIGVAFSNDGIRWKKYPDPVILPNTNINYGVGQPVPYNTDHKSAITLFYEDANTPCPNCSHIETTSSDGIHFAVVGTLTTNGLPPNLGWSNIAYDDAQGYWYAAFSDVTSRPQSATGGVKELGGVGLTLFRIPASSLLTGATPWQQLQTFDTNWTGKEQNFIAGLLRDAYGNVNVGPYPVITLFTSISNPAPPWNASSIEAAESAAINRWDLGEVEWDPSKSLLALNQYANSTATETTTGWIDPNGGFALKSTLGYLYKSPQQGATVPFYGCKEGTSGYFISTDESCGGNYLVGLQGYGYSQANQSISTVPLYSCNSGGGLFVSNTSHCDGQAAGTLLGFALR
jgi:hypothetical protein